jgi:hypothetical protein
LSTIENWYTIAKETQQERIVMESASGLGKWRLALVVLAACTILSGCVQPNSPPVISELRAETNPVRPSANSEIVCLAVDVDGGNLTYTWSANGGTFSGEGSTITWLAPATEGTYNITVNVTDNRGGVASEVLGIRVKKPG